jgi:hypothetical protein
VERVRRFVQGLAETQERAERTLFGQGVISGLIVIIFGTALVWCMPVSTIRNDLLPVINPVAMSVGLDQYWGVFAPNPPRQVDTVQVQVTMSDGTVQVWRSPHGDPVIGQFSWYHWQKLEENLVKYPGIRPAFCRWVAGQLAGGDVRATRVRMLRNTVTIPPPGSSAAPQTKTAVLYDAPLGG